MPLNTEVTRFLDELNHPLRQEIDTLRQIILDADNSLTENIKWNGPNYAVGNEDRITMKIQPPKQIQLVFHRGAKVKEQPAEKLLKDDAGLLDWKANDRAVASFKNLAVVEASRESLARIVRDWILLTLKTIVCLFPCLISLSGCESLGLKDEKWTLQVKEVNHPEYFVIENKSQPAFVRFTIEGEISHDAKLLWSDRAPDADTIFTFPQEISISEGKVSMPEIRGDYYSKKLYVKYVPLNDSTSGHLQIKVKI